MWSQLLHAYRVTHATVLIYLSFLRTPWSFLLKKKKKKPWNFDIVLGEQLLFFRYVADLVMLVSPVEHQMNLRISFHGGHPVACLSHNSLRVAVLTSKTNLDHSTLSGMVKLPCILWVTSMVVGQFDLPPFKTQGQSWPMLPESAAVCRLLLLLLLTCWFSKKWPN